MPTHSGYQRLRAHPAQEDSVEAAGDPGQEHIETLRITPTTKFYGKRAKWALFISLGLAAYIYSLDGTTTYTYLTYATSEFGGHSLLGPIQVAQGIIIAVGKPVIAKVADVASRGKAYCGVCNGLQLLTQVVIADITTLKWRGLVVSLNSLPFLLNAFLGSNISAAIIEHAGWRWGYGMFVILIPIALAPLINQRRVMYRVSLTPAEELDAVGLLLIGASISLTLLPLSLVQTHYGGHKRRSGMLSMFLLGIILIPIFALWDFKWAKYPVLPVRFVVNRSVVGASLIGAFDFMAFYLTFTYLYSFIVVVKDWKLINTTYFMQTQMAVMTICGILTGIHMHVFQRYKVTSILSVALMLRSRGADGSTFELLMTQVLQGIGGGIAALSIQVSAQASVPHQDVAMVTAVVLLITEIGAAGGGAIAGAIWSSQMPSKLALHLPFLSPSEREVLFGSITEAAGRPRGDPVREGVISAYSDVMKTMVVVAAAVSVLPILCALAMPNWHLGNAQNAVECTDTETRAAREDEE
ncbi:major facilitator superfamily domain-containing protein [Mycena galericulata]|nr:major facilitator superfamily domain-containing protein [Mycena galericulata]